MANRWNKIALGALAPLLLMPMLTSARQADQAADPSTVLQKAVCQQDWKKAVKLVDQELSRLDRRSYQYSELSVYRTRLQGLLNSKATLPDWQSQCVDSAKSVLTANSQNSQNGQKSPAVTPAQAQSGVSEQDYIDPTHLTSMPFGSYSHWLQPWRAYLETVPAQQFVDGIGINFNVDHSTDADLIARMLAKQGVRRARIEIGWGEIDPDQEDQLLPNKARDLKEKLLALKHYGIRPLILLNAHHACPGPMRQVELNVVRTAQAGSTTLELSNTKGLKEGYSGLSSLTKNKAAEVLITKIEGNRVRLSKPLPKILKAGESVKVTTLKYRPFSPPETEDYRRTIAGWKRYVGTVARFTSEVLGTSSKSNKGFDLEIWNELTFGSDFLRINTYYGDKLYNYTENSIWGHIVQGTVNYINAHPQDFQGVEITDGFANTVPWPASSLEPERISGISKHPYRGRYVYPKDSIKGTPINALHQPDRSGFVPQYTALFPEHFGTGLQTETLIRDMAPIDSEFSKVKRGRNARSEKGQVAPVPIWITEVNINPHADKPGFSRDQILAIKAKIAARYFAFYLNKGAEKVYLYGAMGKELELAMLQKNFQDYAKQPNASYPANDEPYTSPALSTIGRMVQQMEKNLDARLTQTRPLQIDSITDSHNHIQFKGDGTAAHPSLYNRDVFAFLPYQVNSRRFVIPYYVMTRDVMKNLDPEQYTVAIRGLKSNATVTAYDPIQNRSVPVRVLDRQSDRLSLQLTATDYPYLLIVQE